MQKWLRLEEKLAAQPTDEVSRWESGALYGETFCGMKRGKPTHYAAGMYSVGSDVIPSRHLIRVFDPPSPQGEGLRSAEADSLLWPFVSFIYIKDPGADAFA